MTEKITIIDNSVLFANAIKMLIENTFNKQVIANLTFNDNLPGKFKNNVPDIALIAFEDFDEEQLNKVKELMEQFPETSFIALCDRKESNHHSYVKEHGFKGFINKLNFIKDFKSVLDSLILIPD